MWVKWTSIHLWKRSIGALILGIIVGFIFKENTIYLKPIGDTFLKLLYMMVMPLIFITLLHGIINLKNTTELGTIAIKSILWFIFTTVISISLAIIAGEIVRPGDGVVLDSNFSSTTVIESPTLLQTLLNIIPSNPYKSFIDANVLQVLFLSIIIGIAFIKIDGDNKAARSIIDTANNIVAYIIGIIMQIMPFGIFALLAYTTSILGIDLLFKLGKLAFLLIFLCFFQMFVVFSIILKIYGFSVKEFFKNAFEAIIVGFSTSSSSATLPTTMMCAKDMKINEEIRSFVLPLGSTINMNGSAMHQTLATLFIAQMVGFDLHFYHYIIILITTLISAIGTAGVPGVGLVMLTIVLNAIGLPLEGIAIIAGIDRILDMIRTTVNITGDLLVAKILSKNQVYVE